MQLEMPEGRRTYPPVKLAGAVNTLSPNRVLLSLDQYAALETPSGARMWNEASNSPSDWGRLSE